MHSEPHWIDVEVPAGQLRALSWGPEGAPIALCLHGFPDTAYGWRKLFLQLEQPQRVGELILDFAGGAST